MNKNTDVLDYVIFDYTDAKEENFSDRTILVMSYAKMFEFVQEAKEENRKISVYELGDCLLDWS